MKLFKKAVAALAVALLVLPAALAQEKPIEKKPADQEPTTVQEFVAKAISCDIAEIKLSEYAFKNAEDKDVKEFARKMVDEHTKHRDAMMERAKNLKIAVVGGAGREAQEKLLELSRLKGREFDRAYMRTMTENHEKALRMCQTWARKVDNKEFGEFLDKSALTVKEHLEEARRIADRLK
jgi:putative membrane protein